MEPKKDEHRRRRQGRQTCGHRARAASQFRGGTGAAWRDPRQQRRLPSRRGVPEGRALRRSAARQAVRFPLAHHRARPGRERDHAQDLRRERRGDEGSRRRRLHCRASPRRRCTSSTPAISAAWSTISICCRQLITVGQDVVNGAFKPTLDETALEQIEIAEKKLYDLASVGQTEGGFKPFRAALTEAMVAAEAAYSRAGQLTGVATGLAPARPAAGRPAQVRPAHPGRPSVDGKDGARHQHRLQRRESLSRGARRGRQAQGRRRRRRRLLLPGNVGRTARQPHPVRAGRDLLGKNPQGRADQQRLRQGPRR